MLKVGDYVKCKEKCRNTGFYFKEARKITKKCNSFVYLNNGKRYLKEHLELSCGFTKGQFIEVSDDKKEWYVCKFYLYDSEIEHPFIIENREGVVNSFKFARAIKRYKSYTKVDKSWNGRVIKISSPDFKSVSALTIVGAIGGTLVVRDLDNQINWYSDLNYLFKHAVWEDYSVFGAEVVG